MVLGIVILVFALGLRKGLLDFVLEWARGRFPRPAAPAPEPVRNAA